MMSHLRSLQGHFYSTSLVLVQYEMRKDDRQTDYLVSNGFGGSDLWSSFWRNTWH